MKQEKLLLLGVDTSTRSALTYCKEIGVHSILTNDTPYENNPLKKMADEHWEIAVNDLDALEAKCREEGVTGVFAGSNETHLDLTQALTKRLGLPFYASDEGWACARNKARFKSHCMAVGLDVPQRYPLEKPFSPEVLAKVNYPVIVKPADSSAQRGLTLCRTEEELLVAYDKAMSFSASHDVIVEDYIVGQEISIDITFVNEKPVIHCMANHYHILLNERPNFSMFLMSPLWEDFEARYMDKVEALFKRMECKTGSLNIQAVYKDGRYYMFELGYRLDGVASWHDIKNRTGYSPLELHVDIQLGRSVEHWYPMIGTKNTPLIGAIYLIHAHPGKIAKITGFDRLKSLGEPKVIISLDRFHEGDTIPNVNNMFQIAYFLNLLEDSNENLCKLVQDINEHLHFYDEDGNDLLIHFENYSVFPVDKK